MKTYINLDTWNRKELFNHFRTFKDPNFALTANVDVSLTYQKAKENNQSFFVLYLHACAMAINSIENFKYRFENDKVVLHDIIDAGATIATPENTFKFSHIPFSLNFNEFNTNYQLEKQRILKTGDLYPHNNKEATNCFYASAVPWVHFIAHKEPIEAENKGIPRLSYGKVMMQNGKQIMPVAVNVNHSFVDGYHVGQFFEKFQIELNKID